MADWTSKGWFRHRISSTSDPKFGKLVRLYGAKGYAVYFMALEFIYDGELGDMEVETIGDILKMEPEEVISILETCSESCAGLLSKNEDGTWTSSKATELITADEEKREEKREKVRDYRRRMKDETERSGTKQNATERSPKNIRSKKEEYKKLDVENKKERSKEKVAEEDRDQDQDRPSVSTILSLMDKTGRVFDVYRFMEYNDKHGWKVNGEPIRDLESIIRSWPEDYSTNDDPVTEAARKIL